MQPAVRGFLSHLGGYAAPHVVMAVVLALMAFTTFVPGGESASRSEAAFLALFISAVLLVCSIAGYGCAIVFVWRQHATLPLPAVFGFIAGAITFTAAGFGGLNQFAREAGLSVFLAAAVLGFGVGVAASVVVALTARAFPKLRRA